MAVLISVLGVSDAAPQPAVEDLDRDEGSLGSKQMITTNSAHRIAGKLVKNKFAFFANINESEGSLWPLLVERGARVDDVFELAGQWDTAVPQRDEFGNAVYPFKGTLVSYFDLDTSQSDFSGVKRSDRLVFTNETTGLKNHGYVVEHIDPTTDHGKISYFRVHKEWDPSIDGNTVIKALLNLIFDIIKSRSWISTSDISASEPHLYEAMMSAFRVTNQKSSFGEPGPEGVHQDSCELTAVVLMDRINVAEKSGSNRIWSLEQPFGKANNDSCGNHAPVAISGPVNTATSEIRCLVETTLQQRFDALFLLDREVKHEALPISPIDAEKTSTRDVLTFEIRLAE